MNRKALLYALSNNPSADKVYFNSRNEWLLNPNHLHPIEKSREEVLNDLQQEYNENSVVDDLGDEVALNDSEPSSPGKPGRKKKIITDVSE